ncbi:MAG: metalloregulator ArsR/SmtB family transcription factor [Gemmatimonas sp.]|uniref:ArsR/SmtB family transcription factor n=1 Tax=Gemmatimonas sp. TaxID=1962908 RepID=UPI0025C71182|nr:metalloregulator ArsR/SmtB family transcription factor [Gemmatimonas sp.]MCA2986225.1 metalloregulator ArsR/SmtB family transcription factor [Gemmatimonas sp.]
MTAPRLAIHDRMVELADITRCRLLVALERQELTVGELALALQLPQSTVSRHLRILADQSWVSSRAEGASRWYRRNPTLDPAMLTLWELVRGAMTDTPAAVQDAARIDAVLASRRAVTQAFFATASADWDALRTEMFGARADLTAAFALLSPDLVVGDLGCGTGALSAALAPHVHHVHAVDASPAMLASARTRLAAFPNVQVDDGALEALPLDDGVLDVAVLMLVLHHVSDPVRALREVHRVLRPGGRVLIGDMRPHTHERYREQMGHVWLGFDDHTLHDWLHAAGFVHPRYVPLPVDPDASGPALFSGTAVAMPRPIMVLS